MPPVSSTTMTGLPATTSLPVWEPVLDPGLSPSSSLSVSYSHRVDYQIIFPLAVLWLILALVVWVCARHLSQRREVPTAV